MALRCIGLSGPDGAGKSSVARHLLALLRARGAPARIVYVYGCPICRRWQPGEKTRARVSRSRLARPMRALHELVDVLDLAVRLVIGRLGVALAAVFAPGSERPVLITDRSPLDGLVKFLPRRGSLVDRAYVHAAGGYDAIILLDASTEVLVARDREHDAGYLALRRSEFEQRAAEVSNVTRLDTADASPAQLAEELLSGLLPQERELAQETRAEAAGGAIRRSAGWLTVAAAVVGAANFAYALILSWSLHRDQYSAFLSAQALVLICSMIAAAGLPWALSRRLARHSQPEIRAAAVRFTIALSVMLGAAVAAVVAAVASTFAPRPVVAAAVLAAFLVFLSNPVIGYLQGNERFRLIFLLNVTDVTVRVVAGVSLAVIFGFGTAGALGGFSAGSAVVLAVAGWRLVKEARGFSLGALRQAEMWRQVIGIAAVQACVGCLVNLDQILAAVPALGGGGRFATYQLAGVLGRIPFFISSGLIVAAFPRLARLDAVADSGRLLRDSLLRTLLPVSVVVATLPPALVGLALPAAYGDEVRSLLPYTAAAGMLGGFINLAAMCFQAQAAFRRSATVLGAGIVVTALLITIGMQSGPLGIAAAKLTGQVVAVALLVAVSPWLRTRGRGMLSSAGLVAAASAPLVLLTPWVGPWLAYVILLGVFTFWVAFLRRDISSPKDERVGPPSLAQAGAPR